METERALDRGWLGGEVTENPTSFGRSLKGRLKVRKCFEEV